jgi:hypothetical protein
MASTAELAVMGMIEIGAAQAVTGADNSGA